VRLCHAAPIASRIVTGDQRWKCVEQQADFQNSDSSSSLIAPGVQGKTGQAASTGDGGGLLWTGLTQDFGNYGNIGMNGANVTVARNFHIWERVTLETSILAYNVFNHQVLGGVDTNPTDPNFGRMFSDGWPNSSGRWLSIQARLRF
jgi:hypothetical protein